MERDERMPDQLGKKATSEGGRHPLGAEITLDDVDRPECGLGSLARLPRELLSEVVPGGLVRRWPGGLKPAGFVDAQELVPKRSRRNSLFRGLLPPTDALVDQTSSTIAP